MYWVYALYNGQHSKIYIGQTEDLAKRMNLHKERTFKGSYTAKISGTWELIYCEAVESREQALVRERQLKTYRGREFIKNYIPR